MTAATARTIGPVLDDFLAGPSRSFVRSSLRLAPRGAHASVSGRGRKRSLNRGAHLAALGQQGDKQVTDRVRIAIIGSGPAGLSAAARAAQLGLPPCPARKDRPSLGHDLQISEGQARHGDAQPAGAALRPAISTPASARRCWGPGTSRRGEHKVNVRYRSEVKAIDGRAGRLHAHADRRRDDRGRDGRPGDRHAGQSQPGALPGRRPAARPVSARRSRRIYRRAYHRHRIGRCGDRECARPRRRSGAGQCRHHPQPLGRFRARQGRQRQAAERGGGRRAASRSGSRRRQPRSSRASSCSTPATGRRRSAATGSSRAWDRRRRAPSSRPAAIEFTSSRPRGASRSCRRVFETTVPGIFVIGALAGYPLIKHCMNQGHDVVEFINGNTSLKPADEPILEAKFAGLPGQRIGRRVARVAARQRRRS